MHSFDTTCINEMSLSRLLYLTEQNLKKHIAADSEKHIMDAEPHWLISVLENEILPALELINNWQPTDDEINDSLRA